MDMFFLATSDRGGQPQCSCKGGAPRFVRVLDEHTLAFPNYAGSNGMFLSWGYALVNPQVGLLFIDFVAARLTRLRVEGTASVGADDELLAELARGAVRRARAGQARVPNCPRYIHRMALVERSSYDPRAGAVTPIPEWKRGELATGELPGDRAAKLDGPAEPPREPNDDRLSG
jgi:hypothetical protein